MSSSRRSAQCRKVIAIVLEALRHCAVVDELTFPLRTDESRLLKNTQMVRNGGSGKSLVLADLPAEQLLVARDVRVKVHPRGIAESLSDGCRFLCCDPARLHSGFNVIGF